MFFVHQIEEAYVQKNVIITETKETGVICPAGHNKIVPYNDGSGCAVIISLFSFLFSFLFVLLSYCEIGSTF